jgi:hypothetical protein
LRKAARESQSARRRTENYTYALAWLTVTRSTSYGRKYPMKILNRVTTLHYPIADARPVGTPPPNPEREDEVRLEVIIDGRRYGTRYVLGDHWRMAYRPDLVVNSAVEKVSRTMQDSVRAMLRDE